MRLARKAFPFWVANFMQAFLFGVFHMNPLQGCYAFTLGLVLGYVCERGGSIYYAILFHFLFNLWGTTSQWMASIDEMLLGTIIILGSLILLPAGMLLYNMGIHRREQTS
jgi:membrane protease YdiL (CAAX protease family)